MREQTERVVQGRRAAGVVRRGQSQEIFRIQTLQDLLPLLVGGRRERRFKDASQVPPTELEKTGRVHWRGAQRGMRIPFGDEEPEDNEGTSKQQGVLARGEVRAPRCGHVVGRRRLCCNGSAAAS